MGGATSPGGGAEKFWTAREGVGQKCLTRPEGEGQKFWTFREGGKRLNFTYFFNSQKFNVFKCSYGFWGCF